MFQYPPMVLRIGENKPITGLKIDLTYICGWHWHKNEPIEKYNKQFK